MKRSLDQPRRLLYRRAGQAASTLIAALKQRKPRVSSSFRRRLRAVQEFLDSARSEVRQILRGQAPDLNLDLHRRCDVASHHVLEIRNYAVALQQMADRWKDVTVPNYSDVVRDLVAIHDQFDDVAIEASRLVFTTDHITLEGIELGRFKVEFDLTRPNLKTVKSLDPNPSMKGESYTHPHLLGHALCLGGSTVAVERCFNEGRLLDAADMISGVLHHVTKGEEHARLETWFGIPCRACDEPMPDQAVRRCRVCRSESDNQEDYSYCSECAHECRGCGYNHCDDHSTELECGCHYCERCLDAHVSTCTDCGEPICNTCVMSHVLYCGCVVCGNCLPPVCGRCGKRICQSCDTSHECEGCGCTVCDECEQTCDECGDSFCSNCVNLDGRCESCEQDLQASEEECSDTDEGDEHSEPAEEQREELEPAQAASSDDTPF